MLGEILAVLLHAFSSHPIPSSQVKSADCSDWRTVSGQNEGKRLVTSVLGFPLKCCLEAGGQGETGAGLVYILPASRGLKAG